MTDPVSGYLHSLAARRARNEFSGTGKWLEYSWCCMAFFACKELGLPVQMMEAHCNVPPPSRGPDALPMKITSNFHFLRITPPTGEAIDMDLRGNVGLERITPAAMAGHGLAPEEMHARGVRALEPAGLDEWGAAHRDLAQQIIREMVAHQVEYHAEVLLSATPATSRQRTKKRL